MYIFEDDKENASLGILAMSEGLSFGYSVFETVRVSSGVPEFMESHYDRLYGSCGELGIPAPERNELEARIGSFLSGRKGSFALKIQVSKAGETPVVVVSTRPIPYGSSHYEQGFTGTVSGVRKISDSPLNFHKTSNYLLNIMEKRSAAARGFSEAIFINEKGFVTEGSTTNIFMEKDGMIVTPPLSDGLLPGIVRSEILKSMGRRVKEEHIHVEELSTYDGAVLTNSLIGAIRLVSVDSVVFRESWRLCDEISKAVGDRLRI